VLLGVALLGSGMGDLHTWGSLNFSWGRDAILDQEHLERSDYCFQASDLGLEGAELGISI